MTKPLNLSGGLGLWLMFCLLYSSTLSGNTTSVTKTSNVPPPEMVCPSDTEQLYLTKNLQRITGILAGSDSTIPLADFSCFQDFFQPSAGDHAYDVMTFVPNTTARYTFFLGTNFAGNASVYQGDFVSENPCQNLMGGITTSYTLPIPPTLSLPDQRLGFLLQAGETYSLLISNQEAGTHGNWELTAYNDDGGTLSVFDTPVPQILTFDLLWSDVKSQRFKTTQQWLIHADGSLDTAATLSTFFNSDQGQFNSFLLKLSQTGMPAVTGNCDLLLTVTDQITSNGGCGNISITRNFQAQAVDNNCSDLVSSCQQVLTFRRPGITDVQWPPYQVTIPCDEEFPTDGPVGGPDENPATQVTQSPTLLSGFGYRELPPSLGNLSTFYIDEPQIIVCDGTYKLRRQWRIGDWCAILGYAVFEQYVTIRDDVGPILSQDQNTLTVSVSPFDCNAYVQIPAPDLIGDENGCSEAALTTFELRNLDGDFIGNGYFPAAPVTLAIGEYILTSCAEDDCGNETCIETSLLVRDEIVPIAVCPENLTLLIGGGDIANGIGGASVVEALDIYDGSFDNCEEVTVEIRRNYWQNGTCDPSPDSWSPWSDNAFFYCCDRDVEIRVELRITDLAGNQSTCFTIATVSDEIAPYCYQPDDQVLNLLSLPEGYPADIAAAYETDFTSTSLLMNDLFGAASGTDNCALDTIVEMTPQLQLNECGTGTITRRFQTWQAMIDADLSDGLQPEEVYASINECMQTITIESSPTFSIAFPADVTANCDNPDITGLEINTGSCDILSFSINEPVIYPSINDACYELAITYEVINWSVWDGISDALEIARITEDDGELWAAGYTVEPAERPIISVATSFGPDDENCDGVLDASESNSENENDLRYILTIDRNHTGDGGDSDIPDLTYDNIADSPADCIPTQNYGRYRYTQLVSVSDTGTPEIVVSNLGGPTNECPNLVFGQFGDYTGSCDTEVTISFSIGYDCAAHEVLHSLFSLGAVTAELDTFVADLNSDNDITNDEFSGGWDVSESVISNGDGSYTFSGILPIITPEMGDNIYHALRVQFTDNCGNETTRIITFDIVDCKGPRPICINGLTVNLLPLVPLTDIDGDGELDTHSATVSASMFEGSPISDCTGQGPDTFFGNPRVTSYAIYRYMDVEDPETHPASPADSTLLLTQVDEETVVVYIYAFDQEGNYDYCETYLLDQLASCAQLQLECQYFLGYITTEADERIRDVNVYLNDLGYRTTNYWGRYDFGYLPSDQAHTITPALDTDHSNGITDADITVLEDHLSGTTLLTSPYQLIAADVDGSGSVDYDDLQQLQQILDGTITSFPNNTSWRFVDKAYVFPDPTNPWEEAFPESIYLADLTTDVFDADFIGVKIGDLDGNAEGIAPEEGEAYQSRENVNIGLQPITDKVQGELFEVYQNIPNPFAAATLIGFHLPYNSEVVLTITDLTGRQLLSRKGDYTMGYNSIQLTRDMLQGSSGVLSYTLATSDHVITKKMVVVW